MHCALCLLLPLSFSVATAASIAPAGLSAPLLPEVKSHMAAAHKCMESGSWDVAAAHADLILISETVSVSVNLKSVRDSQKANCLKALAACLDQWESALDGSVHFRIEQDPAKADLNVTFRADVRLKREPVAGLTNWTRTLNLSGGHSTGGVFKAEVQVRTQDLNFRPLSFEAMRQEAEHEFGHILGLEDSSHLGDLMGELDVDHLVPGPRSNEVQAVKDLRDEAKRVKAEAKNMADQKGK